MALPRTWRTHGFNQTIYEDTAADLVCQTGDALYPTVGALATKVVSADGGDSIAGVGIQKVWIRGLDVNWGYVEQTLDLNGGTVTLPTPLLRPLAMQVAQAGANGDAEGNIEIQLADNTVVACIPITHCTMHDCLFTVPEGYIAYVRKLVVSAHGAATVAPPAQRVGCAWGMLFRENGGDAVWIDSMGAGQIPDGGTDVRSYVEEEFGPFPARTDFRVRVTPEGDNLHAFGSMWFALSKGLSVHAPRKDSAWLGGQ